MAVAESDNPITTKGGITLTPDITIDALDPTESAMLTVPGADSWLTGANLASTTDNWYLMYGKKDAAGFFGLMEGASHAR